LKILATLTAQALLLSSHAHAGERYPKTPGKVNQQALGMAWFAAVLATAEIVLGDGSPAPPYPASQVIRSINWEWDTYRTAAPGSDLWPATWGPDDHLYTAWGDGGGFGGTDSDGRVSMGFARIDGGPENYRATNINGGKNPEHPASFPKKGKTAGIAFVDGVLYAAVNLQDGRWPEVNHVLAWSADQGASWTNAGWVFPKEDGSFQPARFVNFGRDYGGVPAPLAGYVYIIGPKKDKKNAVGDRLYLRRAPRGQIRNEAAGEFFQGATEGGSPKWTSDLNAAKPIFVDTRGAKPGGMVYNPGLKRFLLTCYHSGPGQLGVFDAPAPWGPWTTVAYYENWGNMGGEGEGLSCEFPQKWMSADGLTLWSLFSVYGEGAKRGIKAHDKFNLVKATMVPVR
jgi:hypothetical protein